MVYSYTGPETRPYRLTLACCRVSLAGGAPRALYAALLGAHEAAERRVCLGWHERRPHAPHVPIFPDFFPSLSGLSLSLSFACAGPGVQKVRVGQWESVCKLLSDTVHAAPVPLGRRALREA